MKERRIVSWLLSASLMISLPVVVSAAQKSYTATESQTKVTINGTAFAPKDTKGNALPLIEIDGVLYVPAKAYTEALGKSLDINAHGGTAAVSEKKTAANSAPSASKPSSTSGATIGQTNALRSARSYLEYSAFSYKGLIEQLEYEKFSHEDAVYAADNCGADWNEQAAKSAKSYLEYTSFSRDSLIEQLEYEGFTNEQAIYGVRANGY